MKSLRLLLVLLALPLLSLAQQPREKLILNEDTNVRVRLARNLSWANARTGDTIPFEVLEDVTAECSVNHKPYLVIERGAIAFGTVTDLEQDRHLGRGDTLGVTLDFVRLADSEKIALHPTNTEPYFLPMNLRDKTVYPAGTERRVFTLGRADLDCRDFDPRP